jgi:hypothetical protein
MQFASFNGVLRTLFILVCIYYAVRLLARIFFPIMGENRSAKSGTEFFSSNSKTIRDKIARMILSISIQMPTEDLTDLVRLKK